MPSLHQLSNLRPPIRPEEVRNHKGAISPVPTGSCDSSSNPSTARASKPPSQ